MSHNFIESLDPVSKLSQLQMLDCAANKISTLAPLQACADLEQLYVHGNQVGGLVCALSADSGLGSWRPWNKYYLRCSGCSICAALQSLGILWRISRLQAIRCHSHSLIVLAIAIPPSAAPHISRVHQARAAILRALPTLEMFDGKPVKSTEAAAASQVPAVKRVDRAREQPQRSLAGC